MDIKSKKVLVVGVGRSGVPAANRLAALGASVFITDSGPREKLRDALKKLAPGIEVETGGHAAVMKEPFDMVVTSPGVPWESRLLAAKRSEGSEVISEIELAFRLVPRSWVAITGTNGKSTTTALVGAILKESGIPAVVCGNIGNAVTGEDAVFEHDVKVVAEISSFQLEGCVRFRPRVSAILNITPDHLDRHHTMEGYAAMKSRIFINQAGDDVCVLNFDDPETVKLRDSVRCRLLGFSTRERLKDGVFVNNGRIVLAEKGESWSIGDAKDLKIAGGANLENALAATAIAFAAGADVGAISRALFSFTSLPHRIELVAERGGIRYINDSKGTNVGSTLKALEGLEGKVFIILGGRDKDQDFGPLAALVRRRGDHAILIGEAAEKIGRALGDYRSVNRAATLHEAVALGARLAKPGDTVLLSPACASFDMFKNYEDRGDKFRDAVRELVKEAAHAR